MHSADKKILGNFWRLSLVKTRQKAQGKEAQGNSWAPLWGFVVSTSAGGFACAISRVNLLRG